MRVLVRTSKRQIEHYGQGARKYTARKKETEIERTTNTYQRQTKTGESTEDKVQR